MAKLVCLVMMFFAFWVIFFTPITLAKDGEEDTLLIQDFENMTFGKGLVQENSVVHQGIQAARWNICSSGTNCTKAVDLTDIPHDWSGYETLDMWIYSESPTNSRTYVVLYSDNEQTPQLDYYISSFNVTWQGWKKVSIPFFSFKEGYSPKGFAKIDQLRFHTSWYGETPNPNTKLVFDQITAGYSQASDELPIDGFEDARKWTSITEDSTHVKEGLFSGKWQGIDSKKTVVSTAIPHDWSNYDKMDLWMYSEKVTGTPLYVILDSDNPETEGLDYYLAAIKADWTGWKHVTLGKDQFTPSRKPLGFQNIKKLTFHSQWYSDQKPDPATVVYLDDLRLVKESFQIFPQEIHKLAAAGSEVAYDLTITNKANETDHYSVNIPDELKDRLTADFPEGDLKPGEEKNLVLTYRVPENAIAGDEENMTISFLSRLKLGASFQVKLSSKTAAFVPSEYERPKSLISKQELERAKVRISSYKWAEDNWNGLREEADKWLNADTSVLNQPGGHGMWFLCEDSSKLQYDPNSPHRHYCPSEKKYYEGDSYDAGWRYYRHNEIIKAARSLAVAYAISGEKKYAEKAAAILKGYADRYPNFSKQARGGRLYWQTLDEAVSMIDLAYTYDQLYDSPVLSNADKVNIEMNLLRPSAQTISEYDMGRSNWQAWHDTAIGVIGFTLSDQNLIDFAIDGVHGFHYLMKESVLSDGFWWEGSIAYHMYALRALQNLADAAHTWGIDLYSDPSLKKMYDLPLDYAYPNFGLPFNNDGGTYGSSLLDPVTQKGNFDYEGAYLAYHDPKFAWLLTEKYKQTPRAGEYALLKGDDSINTNGSYEWMSRNFEGAGQSELRNESLFALMDYGPYGGSHGHPDKLHLDLFADNEAFAPDFGTPSYGHVLYTGWYKQTASHNTVTVDGASQKEVSGNLEQFIGGTNLQVMKASADEAYPGVKYSRAILMWDQLLLDVFKTEDTGTIHQYDWIFHGLGDFQANLDLTDRHSAIGEKNGYQYFSEPKSAYTQNGFHAEWELNGKKLQMAAIQNGIEEAIVAKGPGPSSEPEKRSSVLLQRQNGEKGLFENVFYAGIDPLQAVKVDDSTYKITHGMITDYIFYNPDAVDGQILAAKASVFKNKPNPFGKLKSLSADGGTILIRLKSKEVLPGTSFLLKGHVQAEIEGVKTRVSSQGEYTILDATDSPEYGSE
ncbi:heparinase II/III domain-containing protein [Metabacillus sp. RGM 3146]|uniref:heparinase II/III domain-containing protein n=1 Tax=Metabacillus sp. RGM 3146 TaxID=3401092 RepID=UPI003B9CB8E6